LQVAILGVTVVAGATVEHGVLGDCVVVVGSTVVNTTASQHNMIVHEWAPEHVIVSACSFLRKLGDGQVKPAQVYGVVVGGSVVVGYVVVSVTGRVVGTVLQHFA
jgi:sugar (pentulose or hexulose) kinase